MKIGAERISLIMIFFNKYPCNLNLKYYCIKERDVSEFINYSEQKNNTNEKDKIIYFQNYKKNY